ncbi:MAG: DapH/DapD/GlmU-related protein, partial [Candidatus Rokubacteria bacterium]|nr:DapH/DapD/GlmU-related protein [Candidatus Rokubacteria bacterium]
KKYISKKAKISKDAQILGNVYIEEGVQILEKACIKGPCYIGKNSYIGNSAILRQETCVEDNVVIGAFSEIKNSIVMHGSKIHSGFVGDSIIGEDCRIGAQFCTANKRIDRGSVKTQIRDEKVDTGLKFLGAIVGNNVQIGIRSSTMPGIIIGSNTKIGPSTTVLNNVSENSKYYTKFQEVIEKK